MHSLAEEPSIAMIIVLVVISLVTLVSALTFCLCCRRKNPKSELSGIEGIVKLKHLDDSNLTVSIDTTDDVGSPHTRLTMKNATLPLDAKLNGLHESDLKRSSANAPHRSLPDIPTNEPMCDNTSELYATVGDKYQDKSNLDSLELENLKKADATSPYARVRSPTRNHHAYDKLKKAEHPYAQVVQPAGDGGTAQVVVENDDDDEIDDEDETTIENPISHRESSSNNNLLSTSAIDAFSAISGRISASQELPYMTPPIQPIQQPPPQQHFSGDSQDSSKGYTSISVREPLKNLIAQTNLKQAERKKKESQDSHYATLSDDSDEEETYAQIEPNNVGDLYAGTSGSETYAQIQVPLTVAAEINLPSHSQLPTISQPTQATRFNRTTMTSQQSNNDEFFNSNIDSIKNIHSRQASSSSCTSSVSNIGSPKPEKRQVNSPLPPTPKTHNPSRNSNSSITEYNESLKIKDSNNNSNKMKQSPSKDLEGMYAKVMKKNKLSNVPSENVSPVLPRHEPPSTNNFDDIHVTTGNEYETIDKKRNRAKKNKQERADVYDEAGYETIPADRKDVKEDENGDRKSQKEPAGKKKLFTEPTSDPKYETLKPSTEPLKKDQLNSTGSDYDPNYEMVLKKSEENASSIPYDDDYAKIRRKHKDSSDDESIPGYSTIKKVEPDYSSIREDPANTSSHARDGDVESNLYSSIPAAVNFVMSKSAQNVSSDSSELATPNTANYESLSNDSTTVDESSHDSTQKENQYERLHNEKSLSPDPSSIRNLSPLSETRAPGTAVDDFFKV